MKTQGMFRKKPVEIQAIQFTGMNGKEIMDFFGIQSVAIVDKTLEGRMLINTLEGAIHATAGDYIIKGVKGEYYPCKPDIFEATYEEALDSGNV